MLTADLAGELGLDVEKPIKKPKATWVEPFFLADVELLTDYSAKVRSNV